VTTSTTKSPGTMLEALLASLEAALRLPDGVAEPAAILWTDLDGQWRPLLPILRTALPQLYLLGPYDPDTRTGPVIWLKCIVDRTLAGLSPPEGVVPVLYLPEVDRQQLRAAGDCPAGLAPLVELQYRGIVWHHRNGRDWTVDAFLMSEDGLNLEVAVDAATREAMLRALPLLAAEPLTALRGRRLEADDFDRLTIGDPIRDLLSWMSTPDDFRGRSDAARWETFRTVCAREYDFDPERDGEQKAGELLLVGGGKWDVVWQRFCEAPKAYRGISTLLRRPIKTLLVESDRRPSLNAEKEESLRAELASAAELPHHEACNRVLALEVDHQERRKWVWAELGESPLAMALEPLARLAKLAQVSLGGPTLLAVAEAYAADGWRCDRAALDAMSRTIAPSEVALITSVLRGLYEPWLDKSARHFQSLVGHEGIKLRELAKGVDGESEVCILFVDGLRFDAAGMLQERLETRGCRTRLGHRFAPLPTVTATAKPQASPACRACSGEVGAEYYTPLIGEARHESTASRLREELAQAGVAVLSAEDLRPPSRSDQGGWMEIGQIDQLGHSLGAKLAKHMESEIEVVAERVIELLEAGWSGVRVVTDHGWLLLPGGLPKVELPHYLVASRWARCATVKGGSTTSVPIYGWHWNPLVRIASPPGIGAFVISSEYAHGGMSVQECVVPELFVQRGVDRARGEIKSVQWRGMRCRVLVETNASGARVDIRLNWKQPATSIVAATKDVGKGGEASMAVADDSHEGAAAAVVVLDQGGQVLDYKPTTVGDGT
jgi:hypothetical protein